MKMKMLGHGIWAGLVLVAFLLGSLRPGGASRTSSDEPAGSSTRLSALPSSSVDSVPSAGPSQASWAEIASDDGDAYVVKIGSDDLERLAREAAKNPNPIARRLAFTELLRAMNAENSMQIREQLVAMGVDGEMWRDFNYQWGAMAGLDAVIFAASSDEPDLEATLSGWGSAAPTDAIAFLDNLPEDLSGDRAKIAASIVAGIADSDRERATEVVLRLAAEGNSGGEKLIGIVAGKTLRSVGPREASRWSESLSEPALKGVAMDQVARAYAKEAPQEAAAWIQRFAEEDYAARGVEQVADSWAQRDPTGAVGWLESLPAGTGQRSGLTSVFGDWEDRDPRAASEYLSSMPQSEQRDSAISGFSRGYAWQDPEAAIAWAEVIDDPDLRLSTLTRAGQAYFRRDPESARVWLQNSGLPPEAQEKVLEPRRRG